jgi:hypothetical protein
MVMLAVSNPTARPNPPVARADCKSWTSAIYQYEHSAALAAGFTVGSIKVKGEYRLLVMDVARTAKHVNGDNIEVWGYGYRLLVEVNQVDAVAQLTLPAIAASVQGDKMWDMLPQPKPLDVESYREYLEAAGKVQKLFASDAENAVPVMLSQGAVDSIAANGVTQLEAREAVATTLMMNLASGGADQQSAAQAAESLTDLEAGEIGLLAQGLYLMLDPNGSGKTRAEVASALLEPLRAGSWRLP